VLDKDLRVSAVMAHGDWQPLSDSQLPCAGP
jgi:hypothetical protein